MRARPNDSGGASRRPWLPWASLTLAIIAFVLDARVGVPAAIAEILYILPPLLGFWSRSRRSPWWIGATVTLLCAVGWFVRGDLAGAMLADRVVCVAVVWITVALSLVHLGDRRALAVEHAIGRSYLDIADVLITVLAPDESLVLVNPKGCELLGSEPGRLVGDNGVERLFPVETHDEVRRALRDLAAGTTPRWRFESVLPSKDGALRTIEWHWAVRRDERGAATYLIGSGTDLTERRQAEASLLGQAALTRLGQMAMMVAHEVKNPLAGIRGAVQVMGDHLRAEPPMQKVVERILRSVDGLTRLVDDLLVFARPGLPEHASIQLLPLLRDVALLLERDPKLARGRVTVQGDDPLVSGDARLLRQAFLNLFLNAAEAGGPDGEVRVDVRSQSDNCSVAIHNGGSVIPAELRTRIFEPFFSTKAHGSGLGLAIALNVVALHGGEIVVQCPAEGGTTMTVTLR